MSWGQFLIQKAEQAVLVDRQTIGVENNREATQGKGIMKEECESMKGIYARGNWKAARTCVGI